MEKVWLEATSYGAHWLDRPAAESWLRMVRDGCPASGITDAGRTEAEQIAIFLRHFTTDFASSAKHDRRVWQGRTYWRRPGKPSAATPGSIYARHVSGRALDLNGATKAWVRLHGHHYGWIKDVVPSEDWHMEYQAHRDVVLVTNPGTSVGGNIPVVEIEDIPKIESKEDEEMLKLIRTDGTDAVVVTDGVAGRVLEPGGIERLRDLGFKLPTNADGTFYVAWVPNAVFDQIRSR